MSEQNNNGLYIGLAAVGLLYFGFLRPITDFLNITKDAADRERDRVNGEVINSYMWSPNFYKEFLKKKPGCLLTHSAITAVADKIKNAWGYINDEETEIFAAFRMLKSKVQVSQLVERYQQITGEDLLTRLKTPWHYAKDGLEPEDFFEVSRIVNQLPINYEGCL